MADANAATMRRAAWNGTVPLIVWAIVLAALPWVLVHLLNSNVSLATNMVIFALIALGFNLLYGHTGELSFGHAAFVGFAAYIIALAVLDLNWWFWPSLITAVAATLLLAFVLARVVVPRSTGIYFSMIMLAFGQVLFFIGERWNAVTGGDDGLQGVPRPFRIIPGLHTDTSSSVHFYILVAVIAWLLTALMWRIVYSPFGAVLHAIRENRQRAAFLGYDVTRYKINAFVLSSLLPAVGGVLLAYYNGSVNPPQMNWTQSGDIVMMTLLGGAPSFWGPILGAALFKFLQQYLSFIHVVDIDKYYEGVIGFIFICFILFAPQGIWGLAVNLWRRRRAPA